jgi:hypothetical protein
VARCCSCSCQSPNPIQSAIAIAIGNVNAVSGKMRRGSLLIADRVARRLVEETSSNQQHQPARCALCVVVGQQKWPVGCYIGYWRSVLRAACCVLRAAATAAAAAAAAQSAVGLGLGRGWQCQWQQPEPGATAAIMSPRCLLSQLAGVVFRGCQLPIRRAGGPAGGPQLLAPPTGSKVPSYLPHLRGPRSPATCPTYGVQRECDSCSIRHLAPSAPRGLFTTAPELRAARSALSPSGLAFAAAPASTPMQQKTDEAGAVSRRLTADQTRYQRAALNDIHLPGPLCSRYTLAIEVRLLAPSAQPPPFSRASPLPLSPHLVLSLHCCCLLHVSAHDSAATLDAVPTTLEVIETFKSNQVGLVGSTTLVPRNRTTDL